MASSLINLKLYRKLDFRKLTPEAIRFFTTVGPHVAQNEGAREDFPYVEADRPRDAEWTDEIMYATQSYAIFGPDMELLQEFATLTEAETAIRGAKISWGISLPAADEGEDLEAEYDSVANDADYVPEGLDAFVGV